MSSEEQVDSPYFARSIRVAYLVDQVADRQYDRSLTTRRGRKWIHGCQDKMGAEHIIIDGIDDCWTYVTCMSTVPHPNRDRQHSAVSGGHGDIVRKSPRAPKGPWCACIHRRRYREASTHQYKDERRSARPGATPSGQ